jgi:5'-nucleotidase
MHTNRRQFLKTLAAGSLAAAIPFSVRGESPTGNTLTILHTNDVHSHLDPFDHNHPKFPNMGGFSRRASLINQLRKQNDHVLLLDAGDIFQGTPYFNFFGGRPELELMSKMQYDAATIGNHEFDNGMQHLAEQLRYADFPFICSNYNFEGTAMEGKTLPWKVIKKGPFRIGIIGLGINPAGLVSPVNYEGMEWLDPIHKGEETASYLRNEKNCNLIIALSHLGISSTSERPDSDQKVAAETSSIDIIIGGHSHTFLDEPQQIKNKSGKAVIINQVGWAGVILGQLDITLNRGKSTFLATQHLVRQR